MSTGITYILDANVFLQCRKLTDLPWSRLSNAESLTLVPAPTAVDEIDKLKSDGNARRARRAREATTLFREVLLSPSGEKTWRNGNATVRLVFATSFRADDEQRLSEIQRPDQRIVEEGLILARLWRNARLITHDTGLFLRARRAGLQVELVPDDWLLADGDPHQAEIDQLRRQLTEARATDPDLAIDLRGAESGAPLRLAIPMYDSLPNQVISDCVSETCSERIEKAEKQAQNALGLFSALAAKLEQESAADTTHAVATRQRKLKKTPEHAAKQRADMELHAVQQWRSRLETKLARLTQECNEVGRIYPIRILVSNRGSRPAIHVRLSIRASGAVKLLGQASAESKFGYLTSELPTERSPLASVTMPVVNLQTVALRRVREMMPSKVRDIRTSTPRDNFAWYLATDADMSSGRMDRVIFGCSDLRHDGVEAEIEVVVFVAGNDGERGAITVEITASNAPSVKRTFPVVVAVERRDWQVLSHALAKALPELRS